MMEDPAEVLHSCGCHMSENAGLTKTREFTALAFTKECLITQAMRVGEYEILPFTGLGYRDELELIQKFFQKVGHPSLPPEHESEIEQRAQHGQPTAIVHIPALKARTDEEALAIVEQEANLLLLVLSLQRGSGGSVFAVFVKDSETGQTKYRLFFPRYRGNLLGGGISGEDPAAISARYETLRRSESKQIYLSLFREALREVDSEFQYFRYWNILEVIARGKNYIGRQKRDWKGNMVLSPKNKPSKTEGAEALVFELLRETFVPRGLTEDCFARDWDQGLLSQQVPIWYRRRNCIVHGGSCLCRGTDLSKVSESKYSNCKRARDEAAEKRVDMYLMTLREVCECVIKAELA